MTMDYAAYSQFVLALVFVLALIGGLGALARRLGFGGVRPAKGATGRRITIVEVRPLDARRKLILLRRDQVEHLILVGSAGETVIERGIPVPPGDFAGVLRHAAGEPGPATEAHR
jgi:flagellar protein FliO/FliZ